MNLKVVTVSEMDVKGGFIDADKDYPNAASSAAMC